MHTRTTASARKGYATSLGYQSVDVYHHNRCFTEHLSSYVQYSPELGDSPLRAVQTHRIMSCDHGLLSRLLWQSVNVTATI